MDRAIEELRAGRCIGVFPEGTRSLGRTLRARSGFGRLADAVPEAQLVCCTVEGTVDIAIQNPMAHLRTLEIRGFVREVMGEPSRWEICERGDST